MEDTEKKQVDLKKPALGCLLVIVAPLLTLMILGAIFGEYEPTNDSSKATERKIQEIEKAFSAWDGSHFELTKYVKARMHDPKSFEHIRSTWQESETGTILVTMIYSSKNAYGGRVQGIAEAKALVSGDLIQVY